LKRFYYGCCDYWGTGQGYDSELISKLSSLVSIPVIAHGGAGKKEDVVDVLKTAHPSAVMISSLFHYDFIKENHSRPIKNYFEDFNLVFY
jgi:cyclase